MLVIQSAFEFAKTYTSETGVVSQFSLGSAHANEYSIPTQANAMEMVDVVSSYRHALYEHFADKIKVNPYLDRSLVSYQADKEAPFYGWFKYREGFTSRLVRYLLSEVHPQPGVLLDPFAGSGTALFAASELGWETWGIEVLPVGIYAINARIASQVVGSKFVELADKLRLVHFSEFYDEDYSLKHIAITRGAFPVEEERALVGYLAYCHRHIADENLRQLALFAVFCILEEISYTRKDGQYLRWDARSGRSQGTRTFHKGEILPFSQAICAKLAQMAHDLTGNSSKSVMRNLFEASDESSTDRPTPRVIQGSCLDTLPLTLQGSVDVILTSPPYCNRYDYTRTYALELVYLGASHEEVSQLRQAMLSCTVENKTKKQSLRNLYMSLGREMDFERIDRIFEQHQALQEVLLRLDYYRDTGALNNPHISRLVRNYFYEMCFVIFEMARVVRNGGHVIMVNDNVRYAGEEVPVDIILSSIAESFGFVTDVIWTLPRGKGNSSQQMGNHGRSELRKCVYVWRKPVHD